MTTLSVDGWGCVPSLLLDLRPDYSGGNEDNGDLLKRSHSCTPALNALNPASGHCQPRSPLDTHRQVWVILFWGHWSFFLGPGAYKVFFVPSKGLFPQSCVSSGSSMVGLMVISSKRGYAIPRSAAARAPAPAAVPCWPILPQETLQTQPSCINATFSPKYHPPRDWRYDLNCSHFPKLFQDHSFILSLPHLLKDLLSLEPCATQLHQTSYQSRSRAVSHWLPYSLKSWVPGSSFPLPLWSIISFDLMVTVNSSFQKDPGFGIFPGVPWGLNHFYNNSKKLFLFSLSLFHKGTVELSRGYMLCDIATYSVSIEAVMRLQLSPIKPDIRHS